MARFAKYHYEEIARIIRVYSHGLQNDALCVGFASTFSHDNRLFDNKKWREACASLDNK